MNRKERRATSAVTARENKHRDKPTAAPTEPSRFYFHVAIQDNDKSKDAHNLTEDEALTRVAVPYQLNNVVRVDGFAFYPRRVKRLKITKAARRYDPSVIAKRLDFSSLSAMATGVMTLGAELSEGEDVTDDLLKQADQHIATHGLVPSEIEPFESGIQADKAFVVMSFSPELTESFEAISEACKKNRIKAVRADKEKSSAPIMNRILEHLKDANFVIADLTQARPNVYYEIGYFDAVCEARGVDASQHLLLVAKDISADAHFDLKHRGIEQYPTTFALMKIVSEWLETRTPKASTKLFGA